MIENHACISCRIIFEFECLFLDRNDFSKIFQCQKIKKERPSLDSLSFIFSDFVRNL